MKLRQEFYRLPIRFDADRLRQEVQALPGSAWDGHPTDFAGNSVARLITVGGAENDEVSGEMAPTTHLLRSPYMQQVLASFGVVWSRSRLMRLAPGSGVPEHADINYHWFNRVRIHIPIITRPEVKFYCGDKAVHMAAGEVWIFDNWRRHRVENPTEHERIHLVADTTGSSQFWRWVAEGQNPQMQPQLMGYQPGTKVRLLAERHNTPRVMSPSEVEILLGDLSTELHIPEQGADANLAVARFRSMLETFSQEWRQLWSLHADSGSGAADYAQLRDAMRESAQKLAGPICAKTNRVPIIKVLEGRVLRHLLAVEPVRPEPVEGRGSTSSPRTAIDQRFAAARRTPKSAPPRFDRPLIIVAAPRSGSTLLFETLACTPQLWTVGGEAHWLVESIPELQPGVAGVESNRLTAEQCSPDIAHRMKGQIAERLCGPSGVPWRGDGAVRFLEKTPKNALRIPFFARAFPDARFVFLWRDPRENISSIMEAWRSGRWITYPKLPEWEGSWSMLLPPGWRNLRGRSLEEIASYQWECTNRIIVDDLAALSPDRYRVLNYADLTHDSTRVIRSVCQFAGVEFDEALEARTAAPLPQARYTLTPARAGKWESNREAIERILPTVETTWDRLRSLSRHSR